MNDDTDKVFDTAGGSTVEGCVGAFVDGVDKGIDKTRRPKSKARICEG